MDGSVKYIVLLAKFLDILNTAQSYTYSVKISTENHANVVDSRFLSFTVDPKYLFSSSEKYNSKQSTCMASSLAPAYIRIAGPSTSHMTFHNATITFTDLDDLAELDSQEDTLKAAGGARKKFDLNSDEKEDHFLPKKSKEIFGVRKRLSLPTTNSESEEFSLKKTGPKHKRHSKALSKKGKRRLKLKESQELAVTHTQWQQFVYWTKSTGFDLVFALNNAQKTSSGLWDPNPALNILTSAEQANVSEIFWQLGYECTNQSIDDYLNDLETLKAIVESFSSATGWRSVGGDVTKCLNADSKSDFRDYVALTDEMMDAVVFNGNSSAQELQRMSEQDRLKLLKLLSTSSTPLWLTDSPQIVPHSELHRAADWMTSLGYSARNGFAVHFRELIEEELFEPTLSFYMALLFKNLVGEKVLEVDMDVTQAVLFAHCTSLRHKQVPGAVTLYGANMDDEMARFAIKLSRKEDGGDIMQFVLGHDLSGNIIINGRPIYEGDIRPIVKRVRAYKTLLLNLPPKSFGFWVIANTRVDACHEPETEDITKMEFVEPMPVNDEDFGQSNTGKTKRSMIIEDVSKETLVREGLKERMTTLNTNINNVNKFFVETESDEEVLRRRKRQVDVDDELDNAKRKIRKYFKKKYFDEPKPRLDFIRKLIGISPRSELNRIARHDKVRRITKGTKNRGAKKSAKHVKSETVDNNFLEDNTITAESLTRSNRKRRNVIEEKLNKSNKKVDDFIVENEIFDPESSKEMKLWRILNNIHKQIKDLSTEDEESGRKSGKDRHSDRNHESGKDYDSENTESKDEEQFVVKTKMSDDGATINVREKTKHGILKTTINNVMSVLGDLNKNLNRFWNALTLLE